MERELQEERQALKEVRTAHRICAAYYQRILPLIERATEQLDLNYESWRSWGFAFPSRRSSPFRKYEWDQLPMLNPRFTFTGSEDSDPSTGYLVIITLVTDSLVTYETKGDQPPGPRGPDATQVGKDGESGAHFRLRLLPYGAHPRERCDLHAPDKKDETSGPSP